jgi:hypothetical protein
MKAEVRNSNSAGLKPRMNTDEHRFQAQNTLKPRPETAHRLGLWMRRALTLRLAFSTKGSFIVMCEACRSTKVGLSICIHLYHYRKKSLIFARILPGPGSPTCNFQPATCNRLCSFRFGCGFAALGSSVVFGSSEFVKFVSTTGCGFAPAVRIRPSALPTWNVS